jgi:hypothetical protein
MNLRAISIGRRAAESLLPGTTGRVLASFSRVCDLVTDGGAVVALAQSSSERGPFTVNLGGRSTGHLPVSLAAGAPFDVRLRELHLFGDSLQPVRVDLSEATVWDPRLPWQTLQLRREQIQDNARITRHIVTDTRRPVVGLRWGTRLNQATSEVLAAHRRRDQAMVETAIGNLCGQGEGLTPQGDDWLAGWLLGLRLAEPADANGWAHESAGAMVLDAAVGRTTLLSQAYLACAAAGEAEESWHILLSRMARHPAEKHEIEDATLKILSHGATSGAAMLQGFLAGLGAE